MKRIAIISDIHANLEALEAALKRIEKEKPDEIICLGDIVGYGADPNPCCDLVRRTAKITLLGNHDAAVVGLMDSNHYYIAARNVIMWTRKVISDENYSWLYSLPYSYSIDNTGFFHSAPVFPSGFFYVVKISEAQAHIPVYDRIKPINFIGHSHLTHIFSLTFKKVKQVTPQDVSIKNDMKFIVNSGSVGQPRDRIPEVCFLIYNQSIGSIEYIRVPYDINKTAEKIIQAGIDEKFAKRLFIGI